MLVIGFVICSFLLPRIIAAQNTNSKIVETKVYSENISFSAVSALELKVFELINIERSSNGLSPLVWNKQIAAIARLYSQSMSTNNFFSHTGLNDERIDQRADSFGLTKWKMIGENIAYSRGYKQIAESIVESWMQSSNHRRNLLNKQWKKTGVGISIAKDGTYFFTQVFLKD